MSETSSRQKFIHELRNGLFVIDASVRVLPSIRHDDTKFRETHQLLSEQILELCALVEEVDADRNGEQ